jgi:inorganic pyrophosphatase
LPQHFISELRNFFEDYKKLENKKVRVENFLGRDRAIEILQESFELYDQVFRNEG